MRGTFGRAGHTSAAVPLNVVGAACPCCVSHEAGECRRRHATARRCVRWLPRRAGPLLAGVFSAALERAPFTSRLLGPHSAYPADGTGLRNPSLYGRVGAGTSAKPLAAVSAPRPPHRKCWRACGCAPPPAAVIIRLFPLCTRLSCSSPLLHGDRRPERWLPAGVAPPPPLPCG